MKNLIYFDYAAATPLDPDVLVAMQPYFSDRFFNPSASYLAARAIKNDIETVRSKIAQCLGSRASEITFTAGGTEANNLAIHGIMRRYPKSNVIVSAIEHESVLAPAKQYAHKLAPVHSDGRLDQTALQQLIDEKTVLVSIAYVNNEIGTIQSISQVAEILKGIKSERSQKGNNMPLLLHTDACQAGNYLDMHVSRLGVDLMTINGGKLYGPKQSGALYVKTGLELMPLIWGGGQERGLRSGTENVVGVIGLATALEKAQTMRVNEIKRLQALQTKLLNTLSKALPQTHINGSLKHRLPNNVHVNFPGYDNERLMMLLDEHGIITAVGSACSASKEAASHVLTAIGLSETEARSSLRFSMGRQTNEAAIEKLVQTLSKILA